MADAEMPDIGQKIQFIPTSEFATSGVYFLHLKDEVVYVGQAQNMWRRIGQHMNENTKWFDSVSCRRFSPTNLNRWERFFIEKLAPRYNKCHFSKMVRSTASDPTLRAYVSEPDRHLNREGAAIFVGMTVEEFSALGKDKPRTARFPRSNQRGYHTRVLREWMASRAA